MLPSRIKKDGAHEGHLLDGFNHQDAMKSSYDKAMASEFKTHAKVNLQGQLVRYIANSRSSARQIF
jgi:hypothetical protein